MKTAERLIMKGSKTKLATAPEGFELYRVCDREGVCHEVKGMWAAEHLAEDNAVKTTRRTQYSDECSTQPLQTPLLKTHVHLRRDAAVQLCKGLHSVGWQQVEPCWLAAAES